MTDRVTAKVGVTKNIGDFNSIRFDYAFETDLLPGETPEAGLDRAHGIVYAKLEESLAAEEA